MDSNESRKVVLVNSPLALVISQLRFPEILGLADVDARKLQRELKDIYPVTEAESASELEITPEGARLTGKSARVYRFRDEDRSWAVTLTPTTLSLEALAYAGFDDFAARWRVIMDAALGVLEIETRERLGLRYVNEIACPDEPSAANLAAIVCPQLMGVVGEHPETSRLVSSMQEMRFRYEDGGSTYRHGLVHKPDGRAVYALDFDFYDEAVRPVEVASLCETLASWNHRIFDLFQWSIQDDLYAQFEPQERSAN